jgi:hypothetical protein
MPVTAATIQEKERRLIELRRKIAVLRAAKEEIAKEQQSGVADSLTNQLLQGEVGVPQPASTAVDLVGAQTPSLEQPTGTTIDLLKRAGQSMATGPAGAIHPGMGSTLEFLMSPPEEATLQFGDKQLWGNAAKALAQFLPGLVELPRKALSPNFTDKVELLQEVETMLPNVRSDVRKSLGEILGPIYDAVAAPLGSEEAQGRLAQSGGMAPALSAIILSSPFASKAAKARAQQAKVVGEARQVPRVPQIPETGGIAPKAALPKPREPISQAPPVSREAPKAEVAKPPKAEIPAKSEEAVGLNKAEITEVRQRTGLDELPEIEQRKWEGVLGEAKKAKQDAAALELAQDVLRSKRQITDTEHAGMVLKRAALEKEYEGAVAEAAGFVDKGDRAAAGAARGRAETFLDQIDRLTEASDQAGRESARALSIRRMMVGKETYSLAKVMQRAKAAKGDKLTSKETARIEDLVKRVADRDKALGEAKAREADWIKERERLVADKVTTHERRVARVIRKKKSAQEKLVAEQVRLEKELAKMGLSMRMGLDPSMAFTLGKYAVNLIKQGANSLDTVAKQVKAKFPELTDSDIYEALASRDPKRQAKARREATKRVEELKKQATLLNQIEKAELGIFDPPKGKAPTSAEIRGLQKRLRDLRTQAYKSGMHPAQLERAVQKVNELQDQLANHHRAIRNGKRLESPELASARQKARDLKREMAVEDQLADLNEQLRTGEFVVHEKPKVRQLSPELERKQVELQRARHQVRTAIDDMAPWTLKRVGVETVNTLRTMKATADMSYTLRQGLVLAARHPVIAGKAAMKAFKSFFSEHAADKIDNVIRSADHHYIREKAGLQLTEIGGKLTRREEMFQSRFLEKIPVVKEVVKASERHMTTGLNLLRAGVFDYFLEKFPNATHAELKAWADWVNVATGRGNLGAAAGAANALSIVIFAPRFSISRVQTPYRLFTHWKQPRVRKEIAKNYMAMAGLGATTLALADLAGLEVGLDPRDPDWGKIRVGNTRIDIWGGFQQPMRVVTRIGLGVTDKAGLTGKDLTDQEKEIDPLELIGRFSAYKLAPSVTIPLELYKGRTVVGEPVSPPETALRAFVPLVYDDIREAYREAGLSRAALATGLGFFGIGVNTYEDSETRTRQKIRRLMREGDVGAAFQLKFQWNMKHPDKRIVKVKR